jgi:hypothetical protein
LASYVASPNVDHAASNSRSPAAATIGYDTLGGGAVHSVIASTSELLGQRRGPDDCRLVHLRDIDLLP